MSEQDRREIAMAGVSFVNEVVLNAVVADWRLVNLSQELRALADVLHEACSPHYVIKRC